MQISILEAGKVGTTIAAMLPSGNFCTDILRSGVGEMSPLDDMRNVEFQSVDFNNEEQIARVDQRSGRRGQ